MFEPTCSGDCIASVVPELLTFYKSISLPSLYNTPALYNTLIRIDLRASFTLPVTSRASELYPLRKPGITKPSYELRSLILFI